MSKILFITHRERQCGVFEFGRDIFNAISSSQKYEFIKAECESLADLEQAIDLHKPKGLIYNYHPSVLPWVCTRMAKGIYRNNIAKINLPQIGFIHEITQTIADTATAYRNRYILGPSELRLNALFDYYIAADPTLLLKNPLVFKTGRLVPEFKGEPHTPGIPTFGSFGFATPKKGFTRIIELVQREFDTAIIRLNMPSADFGDPDGSRAKAIANECRSLLKKPGIKLEISHDYLTKDQLLQYLSENSLNIFLYEDKQGRGISSATDNALAVKKPIAVSDSPMFRHLLSIYPQMNAEINPLKEILNRGFQPLEEIAGHWDNTHMNWEIERILGRTLDTKTQIPKMGVLRTVQSKFNRVFSTPDKSFTWLRDTEKAHGDNISVKADIEYTPVDGPVRFNRILDDSARTTYKPAIETLFKLVPVTMGKKIERANVQQAFVFDTVFRNLKQYNHPKILCVGSYEDTASMGLQKLGFPIEEIDPMINYYLQEFYTKPSVQKSSYDIIFSTSVIEHDPDDKSFVECISGLLRPGGIAVLTCDFKNGWKPGDLKPDVDARLYTKNDLQHRLLSYIPDCELADKPDWDCDNPDFNYLGKYQYTFATFVFRKK